MSNAASHARAFYRQVALEKRVWTIRDDGGIPTPKGDEGKRVMPFWSSIARAERIIKTVPAYKGFRPQEISWAEFRTAWLQGLEKDGLLVGVNWSGPRAKGYDVPPETVRESVEIQIRKLEKKP
jgi:hypothetical protein